MISLVVQRILTSVLLLLAVSVLIFAGTQILPGDVAQSILGQSATPQALANLRESLGLNDPAYVRYFRWLWGILHGDLGTALTSQLDIATSINERLWNTLFLAFWAAAIAVHRGEVVRSQEQVADTAIRRLHGPLALVRPRDGIGLAGKGHRSNPISKPGVGVTDDPASE